IVMTPFLIGAMNSEAGTPTHLPVLQTLSAMAIAYVFGEGLGRLACISFGCCYGMPLAGMGPLARRLFARFHFAFRGETRKIAYESGLGETKVVPVQALTSTVLVLTGLLATEAFLESSFRLALLLALGLSQLWRIFSETLRADYRGDLR